MSRLVVMMLVLLLYGAEVAQADVAVRPAGLRAEIKRPEGTVRGISLVVHGGGWVLTGPGAVAAERGHAARLRQAGWITVNVDYRPGAQSVRDVLAFYDWVAFRWRALPRCVFGESAGGHLALTVAAYRPDVRCVIAHSPATDLWALRGSGLWPIVADRFSAVQRSAYSPIGRVRRVTARVLIGHPTGDEVMPFEQSARWAVAHRRTRLSTLDGGSAEWVHGRVDAQQRSALFEAERDLLDRVGRPRPDRQGRFRSR